MNHSRYILLAIFLSLALVACAGSDTVATETPVATTEDPIEAVESVIVDREGAEEEDESMVEEEEAMVEDGMDGDDESLADEGMTGEEMAGEDEEMVAEEEAMAEEEMAEEAERPAWQHLLLTNARSGETFTLADFAGKTVFVEPMATWCTNCRRQLGNVSQAREQLNGEDVVFVALSVETNIGDGDLAQYAEAAGFDWVFAVMTPEMLQQLVDTFGRAIGNPPSTPHFVIRPDGTTTELVTGIDPPEQLIVQLQAAQ